MPKRKPPAPKPRPSRNGRQALQAQARPAEPGAVQIVYVRRPAAGVPVDHERALTYSAVWACVRIISGTIARLAWNVLLRRPGGGADPAADHPAQWLLQEQSSPDADAFAFRETLLVWALTWGNGYAEIERDLVGRPAWMHLIHPSRARQARTARGRLVLDVDNFQGPNTVLDMEDVFHLKGLALDGLVGCDVIEFAKQSLSAALAADEFAGSFYGNDATPGGVVEHPGKFNDKAVENFKREWQRTHGRAGGRANAHMIAVLTNGMTWKPTSVDPQKAQAVETRTFNIADTCRWFRMQPHKLAELSRATFSNIEEQNIEHVTDTLMDWVARLERQANWKLFGRNQRGNFFTKINVNALMRGNSAARASFYNTLFGMGVFTINRILALEDENPIGPDGDARFIPANMVSLENALKPPEPPPPASAPPGPGTPPGGGPPADDPGALSAAFARLFEEPLARALRREAARAGDAAKRFAGDQAGFEKWLGGFQEEHGEYLYRALDGPARAGWSLAGGDAPDGVGLGLVLDRYLVTHFGRFLPLAFSPPPPDEHAKAAPELAAHLGGQCALALALALSRQALYSPDQPRDDRGRFGEGGGGEGGGKKKDEGGSGVGKTPAPHEPRDHGQIKAFVERNGLSGWHERLPAHEKDEVNDYLHTMSYAVNGALRTGNAVTGDEHERAARLDSAIARGEVKEPVVTHRGAQWRELADTVKAGDTIHDKGFLSTSLDKGFYQGYHGGDPKAHKFFGRDDPENVVFRLSVPAGTKAGYVETAPTGKKEHELLLGRDATLKVTKVEPYGKGKMVHADVSYGGGKPGLSAARLAPGPAAPDPPRRERFKWRPGDFDWRRLSRQSLYSPDQPREPAGSPGCGRFGEGGGGSSGAEGGKGAGGPGAKKAEGALPAPSPHVRATLGRVGRQAAGNEKAAVAAAAKASGKSPEEVKARLQAAWDKAELTVNVMHNRAMPDGRVLADHLAERGHLQNLFETGHGQGTTDPVARDEGERQAFGREISRSAPEDRPKYGAANWEGKPGGAAPVYGKAVLVLNRGAVLGHLTTSPGDSAGAEAAHLGTGRAPLNALARSAGALKAAGLGEHPGASRDYNEIHLHGPVPLSGDTVKAVRLPKDPMADGGQRGNAALEKFAREKGIPVEYYEWRK